MKYSFIHCSKEQPTRQTEDLPTTGIQTASSPAYDYIDDSRPTIVYAEVAQSQEPASSNRHLYANDPSHNKYEANGVAQYSELQNTDNNAHVAAPSGDLYAQVQKH